MIQKKTLFILGAGASMPYGLPSGSDLRKTICRLGDGSDVSGLLMEEMHIYQSKLDQFAETFRKSRQVSIDTFLSKRNDLAELGKQAIAAALGLREQEAALFNPEIDDDWYQTLWNALQDEASSPEVIRHNKVRFVTFNYDRSLEAFLHESVKHSFGVTDEVAYQAWKPIPIKHVYGQLGEFHWQLSETTRPYGSTLDYYNLSLAARSLKVIPESRQDDVDFQEIRRWVEWCERVCFLGFSFDPLNMERLGIDSVLSYLVEHGLPLPSIVASTYGMTESERQRLQAKYFNYGGGLLALPHKNQMLLRETGVLLS